MAFAELSINFVVRMCLPNEASNLYENFTVPPELRIAFLQKRVCRATHPRLVRAEHFADVRSRYCAMLDHHQASEPDNDNIKATRDRRLYQLWYLERY